MKFKLKDISVYFKSSCCNSNIALRSESPRDSSCQTAIKVCKPFDAEKYHNIVKEYFNLGTTFHALTVTIGAPAKFLGMMSADDQYQYLKKHIRAYFNNQDIMYIFHFEITKSGTVHCHGISNMYQKRFVEAFAQLGTRNAHKDSFQPIHSIDKYLTYCNKENAYQMVTNIRPNLEYQNINVLKSKILTESSIPI